MENLQVQQGIIAGCSGGTYTNVMQAAEILKGKKSVAMMNFH